MTEAREAYLSLNDKIGDIFPHNVDSIQIIYSEAPFNCESIELHIIHGNFHLTLDLWNSENDGREYDDISDSGYEPLEPYLISVIKLAVTELANLHLFLNPARHEKNTQQSTEEPSVD